MISKTFEEGSIDIYGCIPTSDNYLLYSGSLSSGSELNGLLFKVNHSGEVIWSKIFEDQVNSYFGKTLENSSGYLICHSIPSGIVKFIQTDIHGNLANCPMQDVTLQESTVGLSITNSIISSELLSSGTDFTFTSIPVTYTETTICEGDVTSLEWIEQNKKTLIKILDLLGREISNTKPGELVLYVYDNGETEMKITP